MFNLLKITFVCLSIMAVEGCGYSQKDSTYFPLEFSGGNMELDSFIQDNYVTPVASSYGGIKIVMRVSFIVDSLGEVLKIKIEEPVKLESYSISYNDGFDDTLRNDAKIELTRVIKFTRGLWIRAEQAGKFLNAKFSKEVIIIPPNFVKRKKDYLNPRTIGSSSIGGDIDLPFNLPEKNYNNGV